MLSSSGSIFSAEFVSLAQSIVYVETLKQRREVHLDILVIKYVKFFSLVRDELNGRIELEVS